MPTGIYVRKPFTEEHKNNLSKNHRIYQSNETRKKISISKKNIPKSEEEKKNMRHPHKNFSEEAKEKRRNYRLSEEHKRNIGKAMLGKTKGYKRSEETRKKMKESRKTIILPVKDTSIEVKIQNFLKQLNIDFLTHQYIKDIEHGYQCDILIPSMNLVIECDGDYWHKYPIGREIDNIRTSELLKQGFKVLRLWECDIKVMELNNFKNVLKSKEKNIDERGLEENE